MKVIKWEGHTGKNLWFRYPKIHVWLKWKLQRQQILYLHRSVLHRFVVLRMAIDIFKHLLLHVDYITSTAFLAKIIRTLFLLTVMTMNIEGSWADLCKFVCFKNIQKNKCWDIYFIQDFFLMLKSGFYCGHNYKDSKYNYVFFLLFN